MKTLTLLHIPLHLLGAIAIAWIIVFILTCSYCYSHAIVADEGLPDLVGSMLWTLKITVFWLFALPFTYLKCDAIFAGINPKKKILRLFFLGLWIVSLAFIVQLLIWQPISYEELPYLAYLFIPKAAIVYLALVLIWYLVFNRRHLAKKQPVVKQTVQHTNQLSETLLVSRGSSEVLLELNSVEYINSAGNYIEFHTHNSQYLLRATMKSITAKLNPKQFIRIHRQYIVNTQQIEKLQNLGSDQSQVFLKSGHQLPVGRQYKSNLLQFRNRS